MKNHIDFTFVDALENNNSVSKAELEITKSTKINIKNGTINGQEILYEEIVSDKLNLLEKNYLVLCRYFDCKQVKDLKLPSITIHTVSFVNVKIACLQKNMKLYIYYKMSEIHNLKEISERDKEQTKTLKEEFPKTLFALFFQYGITLNYFGCQKYNEKLFTYQVLKGNQIYCNLSLIPFFDNFEYIEGNIQANHEKFDEYLKDLLDINILGLSEILNENLTKIKDEMKDDNKFEDSKYELNFLVDLQFFKKLNQFENGKYDFGESHDLSIDSLFEGAKRIFYERSQEMIFNILLDIPIKPELHQQCFEFIDDFLLRSIDEQKYPDFLLNIIFQMQFNLDIQKIDNKLDISKEVQSINDKNNPEYLEDIIQILIGINFGKCNDIEDYYNRLKKRDNDDDDEKNYQEFINIHKENVKICRKIKEVTEKCEQEKIKNYEQIYTILNSTFFKIIQSLNVFYCYLGKIIKKRIKKKKMKAKMEDLKLIEQCFKISGYSANNSESFLQLSHFHSKKLRLWKSHLKSTYLVCFDPTKYKLNLAISAYFLNQKAIKELIELFIDLKMGSNASYVSCLMKLSDKNYENYLIRAYGIENADIIESVQIIFTFAAFKIKQESYQIPYQDYLYIILLARIQIFRLLFKNADISDLQIKFIGQADYDVRELTDAFSRVFFSDYTDPNIVQQSRNFFSCNLSSKFQLIFRTIKSMLEDFAVSYDEQKKNINWAEIKNPKIEAKIREMTYEAEMFLCDIELIQLCGDTIYVDELNKNDGYNNLNYKKDTVTGRLMKLVNKYKYIPASFKLLKLFVEIRDYNDSKESRNSIYISNERPLKINSSCIKYIATDQEIMEATSKFRDFLLISANNDYLQSNSKNYKSILKLAPESDLEFLQIYEQK